MLFNGTSACAPLAAGIAALVLSKDGNLTRSALVSKLTENCDKINSAAVPYTGTPPLTRNDYYGYGRLNAKSSVNATTADTTAPTFTSAQTIHYRAVDVTFSEPMGESALTAGNYSITAGAETLASTPSKVLRISPTVYRLIWASGDMATSGTVTIQASSSIKDVAGNALATTSRNSTGTKRILGINSGNRNRYDAFQFRYTPPFVPDDGFQANEPFALLTSDAPVVSITGSIDVSGVTDPAPTTVYTTTRSRWYSQSIINYSIPNIPSGSYTVRLHFAQIYFTNVGDEVFDIYINGSPVQSGFDILGYTGGQMYKAYIANFYNVNVPPGSSTITVELHPALESSGWYNASICGIEVVKP